MRPSGTELDPNHKAAKIIRDLTVKDFPDTPLFLSKEGDIKLKPFLKVVVDKTVQTP